MQFKRNIQSVSVGVLFYFAMGAFIAPLFGQTVFYQGQVVDYCSGDPLEGVEVRFLP
jgi:hypothetical protein